MHELAPGVYVSPQMKKSVRERLWKVMMDWAELIPDEGGVVLFWRSAKAPSGLGVRVLGWPRKELVEYEGMWLTFRELTKVHDLEELEKLSNTKEAPYDENDSGLDQF
jgi:CRISPR-associated protein Cas2